MKLSPYAMMNSIFGKALSRFQAASAAAFSAAILATGSPEALQARDLFLLPSVVSANDHIRVLGLSANGTAVIGVAWPRTTSPYGDYSQARNFRWAPSTGYTFLPTPEAWLADYTPQFISANGEVVSGIHLTPKAGVPNAYIAQLWRWTVQGGLQIIPIPNDPWAVYGSESGITAASASISADGSTIGISLPWWRIGEQGDQYAGAMAWTVQSGFISLQPMQSLSAFGGISRDGKLINGEAGSGAGYQNLVWTPSAGTQSIPLPNDPAFTVSSPSTDGRYVFGFSYPQSTSDLDFWRWSPAGGLEILNSVSGGGFSGVSADGSIACGFVETYGPGGSLTGTRAWRWSEVNGIELLPTIPNYSRQPAGLVSGDGTVIFGNASVDVSYYGTSQFLSWRWSAAEGLHLLNEDFGILAQLRNFSIRGTSVDGRTIAGNDEQWTLSGDQMNNGWIGTYAPLIETLSTNRATAGDGDVPISVYGLGFHSGATVFAGTTELPTTYVSSTHLQTTIPSSALVASGDFTTLQVTVHVSDGTVSGPAGFTVLNSGVATKVEDMQAAVATSGTTAAVAIEPTTASDGGISATLTVTGQESATVTVATYTSDPSESGNTSFQIAGQFLDLNASGVTDADWMRAYFYYPAGTPTDTLSLKFWNTHLTPAPAAWENVTPATIDPVLHRIEVVFNATSHPKITELDGTFFAPTVVPPIQFMGFLAPIGGSDATGGSFTSPLRTFKAGSTIPVKFSASQGGALLTTGVHRLQAIKYSDATTSGTPIDATPQDTPTTGNQFRLSDKNWQLNLDTKSTGITKGIWNLIASLSDGSQHSVWIQIK